MKMVFDLDGTICFSGKPLSSKMIQALDFLVNDGHEIIFASARPIRDLLPIIPEHMHSYSMEQVHNEEKRVVEKIIIFLIL